MATDPETAAFLAEQMAGASGITLGRMFGEYAVYLQGKVVGLICDNQLYLKPTPAASTLWPEAPMGLPHPKAKPYIRAEALVDEPERLATLLLAIADDLPDPAPKRPRKGKA